MWLAPWFLLGMVGIGLPIWLHRFARQTDVKRPFASLMFLEASKIRRSRRHELRYWLLLAARVLLLLLLALAFAGPLWRSVVPPGQAGATLHVIVIDTSMSMQQTGTWDRARERAAALIGQVKGSDRAMLVAADHRLRVLQEPVFAAETGKLQAQLASLAPGSSRLDYGSLMAATGAWGAGPGEQVLMHLVTDMQQSASPLRFADLRPPPGVRLDLVDVGATDLTNLRVADVREAEREPGTMLVRVEGDAAALAGRTLVLEVNGKERERRALKRDATLPLTERFAVGEVGVGEHRLTARLEPADSLPQDDAQYGLLRRVEPKVLVIAASPDGDDARYLLAALQSLVSPRFEAEAALPSALATRQLGEFAAIVVSDVGLLNQASSDDLKTYVEAGGAALLTLGARTAQLSQVPVSDAKLARGKAREAADQPARVAEMEQSHTMLRETGAWRRIRFFRHVPVVAPEGARVLIRFENGTPLMLEQKLGQGKLLLFASPLDRQWNDLAIHPLFVRFVAEATAYLSDTRADAAAATVGSAMDAALLRGGGGQVFDPQGKRASMLGGLASGAQWVPDMPGFYELRASGRSDFIAVNVDPRESRLARWDEASRTRWLALQNLDRTATNAAPVRAPPGERLFPLWFWLLFGAAILAFMEPLLANYYLNVRRERSL
ncbi:MAG: BatA domain-containing protein [Steroidobacteraceae bacterium]